jgi:hypothetical protein
MYNAFYQRTKETILALNKHIRTSDRFRTAVFDGALKCTISTPCFDPALASIATAPDRLEWRIIDHCAAVTRIYAIYEQFAQEMIREHLSLLQLRLTFFDLPDKLRSSYRSGIAKILDKKDGPRFADLDLSKLISEYDKALSGKDYTIEPRAMLMQEQNLRIPELDRFMNACGIDGVAAWVERHRAVTGFFAASDRIGASAASQMAELIKYRNDAAHGSIDIGDILNVNVLLEFCDFILAVCEALSERVQLAGLHALELHGHAFTLGKITESLRKGTVCIGPLTGTLKIGSKVYLCGQDYCLERTVVSLQLGGVGYEDIDLKSVTEVGMMFDTNGKKNAAIMTIKAIDTPAEH